MQYGNTALETYSTAQVRSGANSYLLHGAASGEDVSGLQSTGTIAFGTNTYYLRAAVYLSSLPTTDDAILFCWYNASSATGLQVIVTHAGGIAVQNWSNNATNYSTSFALSMNAWHVIEVSYVPSTGASVGLVDSVQFGSGTVENASTGSCTYQACYSPTTACTIYVDDLAMNDSTGSAQNSWCGPGQVVMLKPTADSARVGFTTGAAGTTNLYAAVDNTPPIGVVQTSATATSQIEDATSNTTDYYQPTLQTYTAAGVPSGSSISLAKAHCVHGWSTTTSSTSGISGISNPAITEVTGVSGTTAAATYPTGWTTLDTAYVYAPSVTLGTAPVIQFRKGTASTNYAMASQMGMMVEYSSSSGSSVVQKPLRSNAAVMRAAVR